MAPMRRKSHGSIRSPHVKRDSQSQVVIEGWLYKLEGGALKQFKHRWCVLADFCLFFYKGPSEDKVTSSILLPSYKISPCTSDDKISRKFAFKAEHQNMKTYYFAADDLDSMKRWMNAISLASIMQKFVRSENFDATFSSVSNDDEDSGFKSYRSRRYTSQKLNTVHDSHFGTEPLKQRSNSYGDRMGEVYLGSDDKYPDAYKNSHLYKTVSLQDEAPRRQPLYANAPPKPKRLTHSSDNYATYQGEYDPQDYKSSTHDPNMYYYEKTSEGVHSDYHRAMGYVPSHQSRSYDVGSDPAIMDSTPLQYIDNYSKNIQAETAPDLYRSHPPRPRSADFLERDAECEVMPDVAHYTGNNQPQRPKSSLEYYNHYVDSDDGNFDDYREAVRIQADNLYLNKNLNKPHKHPSAKQQTEIDQRLNIHYVGNSGYLTNESVSPCYASTSKSNLLEKGYSINDNLPIYQKEDFNSADKNSKPSKPQESLQRLLEWKQRMLQSPLTKRNHLNSNSSNSSSSMTSPMKSHRTDNYHRKTSRTTETLEAQVHMSNSSNYGNYIHPSNLSHFPQSDTYPKYEESYESQHSYNDSIYGTKKNKINSEAFDHTLPKNVSGSAEKLYKENMLYCVDSENNEILFSYNDNSPNEDEVTSNLQTCHYPPQMHSFSTLPNVSSIGNENQDSSLYDEQCMVEHSKSKYSHTQYKPDFQEPKSTETTLKMTNYSSDDEASADSDNQHHGYDSKIRTSDMIQSVSAENYKKEPTHIRKLVQQSEGLMCKGKRLSVSAGDLLGKTHEELVLLLIQLRRNQSKIMRSREKLENQIENINQPAFHNGKDIQRQIQLLEKQYEVTQPLVTLVDNMVKLGSLYGSSNRRSFSLPLLDTSQEDISPPIQSNTLPHHIGESSILSQLLAEESNLQKRISEIYSLDKGLRLETNSISSLHQDKEMLECTLSGMRNKILDHQDRPSELQKLKKQQKMIEKELIRVKRLLSTSAKKIEDAASKNDQMEKDILYLRQILTEALKTGSTETKSQRSRADIEAELCRVQNVLDELANHRQEINNTVEKLKSESHPTITSSDVRASPITVTEEKDESGLRKVRKGVEVRASPTGVAGSAPLPVRKKQHSTYLETDLDTMHIRDLAIIHEKDLDDIPVYANAEEINHTSEDSNKGYETPEDTNVYENCILDTSGPDQCSMQDINEADERMKRFYGIIPKEKPSEIKTVRIVKRQSERRNRERDKKRVTYDDQSSVWVLEDLDLSSDDHLDMDEGKVTAQTAVRPSSINLITSNSSRSSNSQSAHERLFGTAAKNEQDKGSASSNHDRAYPIKRSKRRHYTVSGYQYMLDPQFSQYFTDRPRSRDDVDMERCLRTANTPDIVRSTIKKNEVFDDKMIERELMLPQKIEIPERYVEVEPEQLSAIEKLRRSQKAENICKMLSETTTAYGDVVEERSKSPEALHKKLSEEKKKRAHLLNLNRAIAREVVEKSKAVAANISNP